MSFGLKLFDSDTVTNISYTSKLISFPDVSKKYYKVGRKTTSNFHDFLWPEGTPSNDNIIHSTPTT